MVIDNASTDGTADSVRVRHPDLELVALAHNERGAGGLHEGLRQYAAGYDWIWLMDDDSLPTPDALAALLAAPMIIAAPRWAWHPGRLFHLQTENANSVLDAFGGDLLAYRLGVVRELDDMWAGLVGRRSRIYRGLMARAHGFEIRVASLLVIKAAPRRGLGDDRDLLRALVGYFWWLPAFWIRSFPSLLVPSRAARAARGARLALLALRARAST